MLCEDVVKLCYAYLSKDETNYIEGRFELVLLCVACANDWLDVMTRSRGEALLGHVRTVRGARFVVNGLRVAPCELQDVQTIEVLRYLLERGFTFDDHLYERLAFAGRVDVLRCALEMGPVPTCTEAIANAAMHSGSADMLRHANEYHRASMRTALDIALANGNVECFAYARLHAHISSRELVLRALRAKNPEILQHLLDHDPRVPGDVCRMIAEYGGTLEMLKSACQRGFRCGVRTLVCAAKRKDGLEMVRYLHEAGCPWDAEVCAAAARTANLETLRYCHENSCPWDSRVCMLAAAEGHAGILKYALSNGCPCDAEALKEAMPDVGMFMCILDSGCAFDPAIYTLALESYYVNFVRSLLKLGLPAPADICDMMTFDAELLQAFHEAGYRINAQTCMSAIMEKNVDSIEYLIRNGVEWDKHMTRQVFLEQSPTLLNFMKRLA